MSPRQEPRGWFDPKDYDVAELRQALWECFVWAGGDTDGDDSPRHIVYGLRTSVIQAVRDLREGYDELLKEGDNHVR